MKAFKKQVISDNELNIGDDRELLVVGKQIRGFRK